MTACEAKNNQIQIHHLNKLMLRNAQDTPSGGRILDESCIAKARAWARISQDRKLHGFGFVHGVESRSRLGPHA